METFSTLLAICVGNSPVHDEFPAQRPVTRSFHVFFDLRPNKQLSKQSWGWWFEMLSHPLWRHCNVKTDGEPGLCHRARGLFLYQITHVIARSCWASNTNSSIKKFTQSCPLGNVTSNSMLQRCLSNFTAIVMHWTSMSHLWDMTRAYHETSHVILKLLWSIHVMLNNTTNHEWIKTMPCLWHMIWPKHD